jgi:dual specificity protein kinase YAK1
VYNILKCCLLMLTLLLLSQGLVEIGIVEHLNRVDPEDRHHIVRLLDYFVFRNHVCLVFELLSVNLYELLKSNSYRGLSLTLVRVFVSQLLDACELLRRHAIVHCDLKPENILLSSISSPIIKLIDFGSACYENHTAFSYIQSRFYRSPEVLIGLPYAGDIDMWSLGCIVAELYLGLPLFAGI